MIQLLVYSMMTQATFLGNVCSPDESLLISWSHHKKKVPPKLIKCIDDILHHVSIMNSFLRKSIDMTCLYHQLATTQRSFVQHGVMSMAVVDVSLSHDGNQHHIFKFSGKFTWGIPSPGWLSFRYSVLATARYIMKFWGALSLCIARTRAKLL